MIAEFLVRCQNMNSGGKRAVWKDSPFYLAIPNDPEALIGGDCICITKHYLMDCKICK